MRKEFIVYPKTTIDLEDPALVRADFSPNEALKCFITGWMEDYGDQPSIKKVREFFSETEERVVEVLKECENHKAKF